jgi:hypothetical protein
MVLTSNANCLWTAIIVIIILLPVCLLGDLFFLLPSGSLLLPPHFTFLVLAGPGNVVQKLLLFATPFCFSSGLILLTDCQVREWGIQHTHHTKLPLFQYHTVRHMAEIEGDYEITKKRCLTKSMALW